MDSRERVKRTLCFDGPDRLPSQVWILPWAVDRHPAVVEELQRKYPDDIVASPSFLKTPLPVEGDRYTPGTYVDEWGCTFVNIQKGAIGEVKTPYLADWSDVDSVRIPRERLTVDIDEVNAFCRNTDKFVYAGVFPRPFERLQFIRGTVNLLLDLMDRPDGLLKLMKRMHEFYLEELEVWAKTEVDALYLMDDWGSQNQLLVAPDLWRELFKPLYKDYAEIARRHGKYLFLHSDGYILDIMEDLIELDVDAVNSQVFIMGIEEVGKRFAGKITFWGELDRQHLLVEGTRDEIFEAVKSMKKHLYRNGGVIGQFEFGLGAKPENVLAACEAFNR
jgi:hypothetical protein